MLGKARHGNSKWIKYVGMELPRYNYVVGNFVSTQYAYIDVYYKYEGDLSGRSGERILPYINLAYLVEMYHPGGNVHYGPFKSYRDFRLDGAAG